MTKTNKNIKPPAITTKIQFKRVVLVEQKNIEESGTFIPHCAYITISDDQSLLSISY